MTGDRQTILIVDDVEINRAILAEILRDKYDILEAENGKLAVDIINNRLDDLCLVLLDMTMPVMDGKEVLAYMKEKMWLEKLPVIIISADSTESTIQEAYELGITDYFIKPFERNTVIRRVRNTIALYERNNVDINNSMEVLSGIYRRIIKVNLDTGNYLIFKNTLDDLPPKEYNDIYAWLDAYLYNNYVYEEDKAAYIEFCNRENLIAAFEEGAEKTSVQYRRNTNGQYQWAVLEIVRSKDYSKDNPIVIIYVRAIDDEYVKHIESIMQKKSDSIAMISVNVSSGVCTAGNFSEDSLKLAQSDENIDAYVNRVSHHIIKKDSREEICSIFSQDQLLQAYSQGKNDIKIQCITKNRGELFVVSITMDLYKNPITGEIEGILSIDNITREYLSGQINSKLYRQEYDKVMLIDTHRRDIVEDKPDQFGGKWRKKREDRLPYDVFVEKVLDDFVEPKDHDEVRSLVNLDRVIDELKYADDYRFTAYQVQNGIKHVKEYSFVYLDRDLGVIIGCSSDMTAISNKDMLTGGVNRQGFLNQVDELFITGMKSGKYAIIFFDIRNFKAINELFGMSAGDLLLGECYKKLQKSSLEPIVLSRLEADHFAALVKRNKIDLEEVKNLCQLQINKNGKLIQAYLECGIYVIREEDLRAGEMLDKAGVAKSFVKGEDASPYKIYDDTMKNAYVDRATLVSEVLKGIDQGQFKVYYQPVVDANTGRIVSAEALVRWYNPDRGFISPGIFIPALEKQGHISELDAFVAKEVERFQLGLSDFGIGFVPVSVNLSWVDFFDQQFMSWIKKEIVDCKKKGIKARIEITESSCAAISQDRNDVLKEFRQMGAELLMDDFGTGYSSFGMLQNYHFDILKLDIEFVRQLADNSRAQSITAAIITMAHSLGMKVIAEGAEDPDQVEFLKSNGCDYIQGYYFYKPMPEEDFRELLQNQQSE